MARLGIAVDILMRHALAAVLALFAGILIVAGPMTTNDGPVHMSFSRFLWSDFGGPLQRSIYEVSDRLAPNLLLYWLAAPLTGLLGQDAAEAVVQFISLAALPVGGAFVAAAFGPVGGIVTLLLGAIALNRLFFLGLYNFCLSLGIALVAFGALVRATRGHARWWPVFSAALAATVVAHAAGLVFASLLAALWMVPRALADLRAAHGIAGLVRRHRAFLLSLVPAAALVVLFASESAGGEIAYGKALSKRLRLLASVDLLANNGPFARLAPTLILLLLGGLAAFAVASRLRRRPDAGMASDTAGEWRETVALVMIVPAFVIVALVIPDTAGGGWTHSWRMIVAAWVAASIVASAAPLGLAARRAAFLAAGVALAMMGAGTAFEQWHIRAAIRDADATFAAVPRHCTVLPLITHTRHLGTRYPLVSYDPLFHLATRIEQAHDRVALFNYLARLDIYPIRYRTGMDPFPTLFGWQPYQQLGRVSRIDIDAYEAATGRRVDFVLVQGPHLGRVALPDGLFERFELVVAVPHRLIRLYRRIDLAVDMPCA